MAHDTVRRPSGVIRQACTWCRVEQPVGEFYRNPETGWITRECRTCAQERAECWARVDASHPLGRRRVPAGDGPLLCVRCGRTRERSLFYTYSDGSSTVRYRSRCKQCMGALQNASIERRGGKDAARRRRDRDRWLRKQYGIGLDDYLALLDVQGGACAVCRTDAPGGPTPGSAFHVDHDHATGQVRGLLCRACNTALGLLGEDRGRIAALVGYLDRWPACDYHPGVARAEDVPAT